MTGNPIVQAYNTIDNVIMSGFNAVNRAYTWTTGRNNSDLVNVLFAGGVCCYTYKHIISGEYGKATIFGTILSAAYLQLSYTYSNYLSSEQNSLEKGCKYPQLESFRECAAVAGPLIICIGCLDLPIIYTMNRTSRADNILFMKACLQVIADFLAGSGFYMTRTENLPPGKSVVRRMIERFSLKPCTQPSGS